MMATLVWSFSTVMVAEERRRAEAEVGSPKADVGAHAAVAVKRTFSELFNTRRMNQQADNTGKTPANVCAGAVVSPGNVSVFLYFSTLRSKHERARTRFDTSQLTQLTAHCMPAGDTSIPRPKRTAQYTLLLYRCHFSVQESHVRR